MLYNKRTHQKINDKKILRRVNSQWVVVSVATLLLAGAIGLTKVSQVSADTNQVGNQAESVSGTAVLTPPTGGNSYTVADANNYSDQIQQGYLDGYQGKSNQSQTLSGRGADYYNAAYAGAQKTLQAYNSATQGQGAGNQDYYFYGNTAKKADGFSNDNKDAQTGINGSALPNSDADKASEQGTQVSNVQRDDNSTHFNSVLTDGTPQNYGASDDVNQGGADTPKEAKASVKKYESTLVNLFNSSNNTSIKVSDYNQTITIPTSTDSIIASYRNGLVGSGLQKAFESAVNYTLGQLGQRDAETGKWQGVYHGSNGQTKDFYLSSNAAKVTSPYDQAYRGAKSAMNRYFTNNIYNGNTAVAQSDTGNFYYDQGFNDIVTQASNGVVYVANGQQWSSIMTGQIQPYTVGGYVAGNINTVKLVNDIDLTGATNGENDGTIYTNMSVLTVDGQHHMMDFHGNNYTVNRLGPGALDLYVQNFQTLYGSNYFGPFRAEAGASLHFSNLNYVGPQLLSSYNNDSYASGNINVVTPTSSDATYTSPFQTKVYMEGGGNQQNLEVNNFILETNAHFFGNASPVRGGINVVVQGNFTIGENAKMTLIPRGFSNSEFTVDSSTWGVWLRNTGSSLNINKNATLNIIPDNFQGDKYIFGGAVYKAYAIQININGGTLNYEAQGGLAGYYNQPIDLQGGSGTQISVTNGGLMQVMMDQVPDGQGVYSYTRNGHQATWNALINNVGQGIFNVGARGNLKVGVTNSDTSYIVPYYGPISINTIGSNHAIFIKTPTVSQFQTTSSGQGLAGSGTAGNINAYTVAVYDGTRKRYLYNFSLASGSNQYTGIDLQGNQISGTISGNTLEIFDVPSVSFVGNLSKTIDADGTATITGYARLANFEELDNNPEPIYVGIATSNTDPQGNYNNLTQVSGSTIVNKNSIADPNTYVSQIATPADYKGGIIPITFKLAKGQNPAYIGMRLHYGVSAVNSILTPDKYYTTVEGYQQGQNGKVLEVVNGGDMQVATGSLADISTGLKDAIVDSITGSSASRDQQSFNQKANADYLATYASVQSGFSAYKANPDKDPTTIPAYYSSSNPAAFVLGFNEAAYQTGVQDARFNVTNVVADKSQKYQEAQDYYKKAYQETQLSVNQGKNTSQIQSKYPSTNSNSTPDVPIANTAAYQGISDAQALVAFFSDIQSGKNSSGQFNALTKEQQAVYNDAKIGFQNALMVDRYAVNPDMNANKVEQDAFDYVQSMINGALSQNKPVIVDTSYHLKNLEAAQIGWQLAQDAVASARTNGIDSIEAQLSDPSQLNSDKSINATVYQYLKFGAYAGLQGKTDTLLNTLEKVGYNQVIIPVAKQEGINAVNQLTGSKATSGVAAASQTGLAAFGQGYADAIASYKNGYNAGLIEAQKHGLVSDQPTIPNNVTDQLKSAYLAGYHGAVDGYKDGQAKNDQHRDKNGSPLYQDAYQKSYASSANLDEKTSNSNQNNNNSSNNDNNQESNEIVPDGAKLFLNNEPAPSGNSEENQNILKNYNATQQGFVDILSGNKTDTSNYATDQKSAYDSGKKAANDVLMVWKSAMLSGQQVLPVQGIPDLTSATNDAFNATVAQVEGIGYLISDKPMNQIILSTLGKGGISNYNNGVLQSLTNPQAMGEDFFTQAGIKDVNDGYRGNAQTGNVSSNGYLQGLELKENEATGIDQANNDATVTMSDPTAQDALLGTKDAYNDVFNRGGSQDVSHRTRAYQDAYLQAVNSATNLNLIPSILNSVTNRAGNPFLKNSAQSLASSQVFTNAQNGFDDALNGGIKAKPSSQDKSYLTGFNAGLKVQSDYQRAWSEQLPKVNSQDSDTYNGAAAAIIAVYQYGTKSHIGVDEIHNGAYVAAYNLAVDQANAANNQATNAILTGNVADHSRISSAAAQLIYDHAYQQVALGMKLKLSQVQNPNAVVVVPSSNDQLTGYQAAQSSLDALNVASNSNVPTSPAAQQAMQDAKKQVLLELKDPNNDENMAIVPGNDVVSSQIYKNSYFLAKQAAAVLVNAGVQSYLTGDQVIQETSPAATIINLAIHQAQSGFEQGIKGGVSQQPANSTYQGSYQNGYQAGLSVYQAIIDSQAGHVQPNVVADTSSYQLAQAAYQSGLDAVNGGKGLSDSQTVANNPINNEAYQKGMKDGLAAQENGLLQFQKNPLSDTVTTVSANPNVQKLAQVAMDQAKVGFDSILIGTSITNPTAIQLDGMNLGRLVREYADSALNNENPPVASIPETVQTAVQSSIDRVKKLFESNPDISDQSASSSSIDPYVYFIAVDRYQKEYDQGVQLAQNLRDDPKSTPAESQGFKDFWQGINSKIVPGQDLLLNPNRGQNIGIIAAKTYQQGYQAALDRIDVVPNNDPISQDSFVGAQEGFNDSFSDKKVTPDHQQGWSWIKIQAYRKAQNTFQDLKTNGAIAFLDGKPPFTILSISDNASQLGYQAAESGYQIASTLTENQLTDEQKTDKNFMLGFKAYKEVQKGLAAASTQVDRPDVSADKNQRDAYQAAQDAILDGQNPLSSTDLSRYSQAYQTAYCAVTHDAQDGSRIGLSDAKKPDTLKTDIQKESAYYQQAYQTAYLQARQAIDKGIQAFITGQDQEPLSNDLYQYGYQKAQAGYLAGISSSMKPLTQTELATPSFMFGFQVGQATLQAIEDQEKSENHSLNEVNQIAYKQAIQAFYQGVADVNKWENSKTLSDNPVNDLAYQAGKQSANQVKQAALEQLLNNPLSDNVMDISPNSQLQALANQIMSAGKKAFLSGFQGESIAETSPEVEASLEIGRKARLYVQSILEDSYVGDQELPIAIQNQIKGIVLEAKQDFQKKSKTTDQSTFDHTFDQLVYDQAILNYQKAYLTGVRSMESQENPITPSWAFDQGRMDYLNGLKSIVVPKSSSISQANFGQQAGIDAADIFKKAYQSALDQEASPHVNDIFSEQVFAGAQTGFQNGLARQIKGEVALNQLTDPEKLAYQLAVQEVQDSRIAGAQDYIQGKRNSNGFGILNQAMNNGYQVSQNGYKWKLDYPGQELTSDQKEDNAFMIGYQAYEDAQSGQNLAITLANLPVNSSTSLSDAYYGIRDGYKIDETEVAEPDLTGKSPAYQDAYLIGKQSGKIAYSAGSQAFLKGYQLPHQSDLNSQVSLAGYQKTQLGFNDGVAGQKADESQGKYYLGYQSGQAAREALLSKTEGTVVDQNSYNSAQQGYQDALKEILVNPDQKPTVIIGNAAYQYGFHQGWMRLFRAYQKGLEQFSQGGQSFDISDILGTDDQKMVFKAMSDSLSGFQKGLTLGLDFNLDNEAPRTGYDLAKSVLEGIARVQKGQDPATNWSVLDQAIQSAKHAVSVNPLGNWTLPTVFQDNLLASVTFWHAIFVFQSNYHGVSRSSFKSQEFFANLNYNTAISASLNDSLGRKNSLQLNQGSYLNRHSQNQHAVSHWEGAKNSYFDRKLTNLSLADNIVIDYRDQFILASTIVGFITMLSYLVKRKQDS